MLSEAKPLESQAPRDHLDKGLFLDDRLGRGDCACGSECRYIVSLFRFGTARFRRQRKVIVASTPSEFLAFDPDIVRAQRHAMAIFDFNDYPDFNAVMEAAKDTSEKRGRANREVARAERLGYYVKPFAYRQFIPDIFAIHNSKDVRQGRQLSGPLYSKTIEEMGGAPVAPVDITPPACPQHHWLYWGVFLRAEGHRQGEVQTDEQLVAYVRMRRQGESAAYTVIMGHGDHLRHGVMYLMHYKIVAHMLGQRTEDRPRYLTYLHYTTGQNDGIDVWKHRALFKPRYIHYVEDRPVSLPCDPPMPALGEALLALKATVFEPWPRAVQIARTQGVPVAWLKSLHHMWVVERTHAPRLTARVLRDGPNPPLNSLRPLASGLFPIERLEHVKNVSVVLSGDQRGLDCLLPMRDAGLSAVTVYHPRQDMLETLAELYGGDWTFERLQDGLPAFMQDDGLVIECPPKSIEFIQQKLKPCVGRFAGSLLLSFDENVLGFFGYDAARIAMLYGLYGDDPSASRGLSDHLGQLLGRPVHFRGIYYRHGEPETYWIALELPASGTGADET